MFKWNRDGTRNLKDDRVLLYNIRNGGAEGKLVLYTCTGKYALFRLIVVVTNNNFLLRLASKANFALTCDKRKKVANKTKLTLSFLFSTLFKLNQTPFLPPKSLFRKKFKARIVFFHVRTRRCDI